MSMHAILVGVVPSTTGGIDGEALAVEAGPADNLGSRGAET